MRPIVGVAAATVRASPAEVFDFVLDLDRYRRADRKVGPGRVERRGDRGTIDFAGRLRGLPGPRGTYPFDLTATRLTIGSPVAGPARWFLEFEGSFECTIADGSTHVAHREMFDFRRPWCWIAVPLLRRWLQRDVSAEMVRFAQLVGEGAVRRL